MWICKTYQAEILTEWQQQAGQSSAGEVCRRIWFISCGLEIPWQEGAGNSNPRLLPLLMFGSSDEDDEDDD